MPHILRIYIFRYFGENKNEEEKKTNIQYIIFDRIKSHLVSVYDIYNFFSRLDSQPEPGLKCNRVRIAHSFFFDVFYFLNRMATHPKSNTKKIILENCRFCVAPRSMCRRFQKIWSMLFVLNHSDWVKIIFLLGKICVQSAIHTLHSHTLTHARARTTII